MMEELHEILAGRVTGNNASRKETNSKNKTSYEKEAGSDFLGDLVRFITAVAIAVGIYSLMVIIVTITTTGMSYAGEHSWALIFSLIILVIFGSVQKTKPVVGFAVLVSLVFLYTFDIVFIRNTPWANGQEIIHKNEVSKKIEDQRIQQNKIDSLKAVRFDIEANAGTLPLGITVKKMRSSDSTSWIKVPEGVHYSISSKNSNHLIKFSDGSEYMDMDGLRIPDKSPAVFKVIALEDEVLTIVFTRNVKTKIKKITQ